MDIKDHKGTKHKQMLAMSLKTHRYHGIKHSGSQETIASKTEKKAKQPRVLVFCFADDQIARCNKDQSLEENQKCRRSCWFLCAQLSRQRSEMFQALRAAWKWSGKYLHFILAESIRKEKKKRSGDRWEI